MSAPGTTSQFHPMFDGPTRAADVLVHDGGSQPSLFATVVVHVATRKVTLYIDSDEGTSDAFDAAMKSCVGEGLLAGRTKGTFRFSGQSYEWVRVH